jgi:hypothetical protein
MLVTIDVNPHILYNCRTADEVAQRMKALFDSQDTEGVDLIGVYAMPAAKPEGDDPQFDVTLLLKRTLPFIEE